MKSNYFKIGDKFDYSKGMILRKEIDENGVEKSSYLRIGADFLGCTIIPGFGIRSPEPESLILLSDGSFIDVKAGTHIPVNGGVLGSPDALDFDENGIATISLSGGGDVVFGKESGMIMSKNDEDKLVEIEEQEINQDLINIVPNATLSLAEILRVGKPEPFDLMEKNDSAFDFETVVKENGKEIAITSKMEIVKEHDSMFSISNNENKNVANLVKKDDEYYLDFASNTEIDEFIKTEEGQKIVPSLMATGDDNNKRYMFKVNNCVYTTGSGFHIEALGGAVKFECNGASSAITLGKKTFIDRIVPSPTAGSKQKATGYNATMSTDFIDSVRLNKGPFSFAKNTKGTLKDLDGFAANVSTDEILALLNLGENKDGIKHYKSEGFEIFGATIDIAPNGTDKAGKTNLLFVKEGTNTYVHHDGKFVPLQNVDSKTNSMIGLFVDNKKSTNMALELSPTKAKELSGKTIVCPFIRNKKNSAHVDNVINGISNFLAKDGTAISKPEKRTDLYATFNDTNTRLVSVNKKVRATATITPPEEVKYPEKPEKKKEEKTNKDPGPSGDNNDDKKGDNKDKQKKATGFWDVVSNSCFMSTAIFAMLGMFGLGFIAFPLMIAAMTAGIFTKSLSWLGGFSGVEKKAKEFSKKQKGKSKEKSKEKYKENTKDIQKSKDLIAGYEKELEEYEAKGQQNSKQAKKVQKLLNKEKKKLKKLNKTNKKLLRKKPLTKIEYLGEKPDIKSPEPYRDGFIDNDEIVNSVIKDMLEEPTKKDKKGKYKLKPGKNTTKLLDNLTMEERAVLTGNIEEIEKAYGGAKNNAWVNKLIKRDYLASRETLTPEQQTELNGLNKELGKAKTDLGEKTYKEWETYIKKEAIAKQNYIAKKYGITGIDLFSLRKHQINIMNLGVEQDLTEKQIASLIESSNAIKKAQERLAEFAFAEEKKEMMKKLDDPNSDYTPEQREEWKKRYNDPKFAENAGKRLLKKRYPELIKDLDPTNVLNASSNPITIRKNSINSYVANLDHRDFVETKIKKEFDYFLYPNELDDFVAVVVKDITIEPMKEEKKETYDEKLYKDVKIEPVSFNETIHKKIEYDNVDIKDFKIDPKKIKKFTDKNKTK